MFNLEPKKLQRFEPLLQRVLVVDPQPAAARVISDLVKDMGAREVTFAAKTVRGLEAVQAIHPQVIFVEMTGPDLDGLEFTRYLRRSDFAARMAPVIMVTSIATAATIKAARDAGVHEFLRKPFT